MTGLLDILLLGHDLVGDIFLADERDPPRDMHRTSWTNSWKSSVRATKSLSQLISTMTPNWPMMNVGTDQALPGRARRLLAGRRDAPLAQNHFRFREIALASTRALLHSIIPAPVRSAGLLRVTR